MMLALPGHSALERKGRGGRSPCPSGRLPHPEPSLLALPTTLCLHQSEDKRHLLGSGGDVEMHKQGSQALHKLEFMADMQRINA